MSYMYMYVRMLFTHEIQVAVLISNFVQILQEIQPRWKLTEFLCQYTTRRLPWSTQSLIGYQNSTDEGALQVNDVPTKLAQSDSSTTGMEVDEKDTNPPLQPKKDMLRKSKKRGGDVGKVQYIKSTSAKKKDKRKMEELDKLTTNDLLLICDLFYLPYEYGPRGVHLLKTAHWLISNVDRLSGSQGMADHKPPVREWYESAMHFHDCHKDLCQVVDKFVNITNRDLLYELYNYVSDMRSCMSLVNGYIKWHGKIFSI